jgi:hypothetical protein
MLYNVYRQNKPSTVAKSKPNQPKMFEMDIELVDTIYVEAGCPIEAAKSLGHVHPLVECVNGYDLETGKPLKS